MGRGRHCATVVEELLKRVVGCSGRRDPAPACDLGGIRCTAGSVLHFVPDRADCEGQNGSDLGGIRIWAGSVSETETIPAQNAVWNDSRPDHDSVSSAGGLASTPYSSVRVRARISLACSSWAAEP